MFQIGDLFLYESKHGSRTFGEIKKIFFKSIITKDCDCQEQYVTSTNGVDYNIREILKVTRILTPEEEIIRNNYLKNIKNNINLDAFNISKLQQQIKKIKKPN